MGTIMVPPFTRYGRPTDPNFGKGLDYVNVINEDFGLNAALLQGTNDLFETTIPYPAEWDQDTEVVMMKKAQGFFVDRPYSDAQGYSFDFNMSYLDRRPAATYRGLLSDANEEWFKSIFVGPMKAGRGFYPTGTANLSQLFTQMLQYGFEYVPEVIGGLSMFFPIYIDIANQTTTVTVTSGADAPADFPLIDLEKFVFRYFYTIRRQTRAERDFMASLSGVPMRWSQLAN